MKLLVFIALISLISHYKAFLTQYSTSQDSIFRSSPGYITPGTVKLSTNAVTKPLYISNRSQRVRHVAEKAHQNPQARDQTPSKSQVNTNEDSFLVDSSDESQESPGNLLEYEGVSAKHKELELKRLRDELTAFDPDASLRELYIKGHGPGGQKINKSTICVQLVYSSSALDKKVVVRCKKHRQLLLNRVEATTILLNKLKDSKVKQRMKVLAEEGKVERRILKLSEADKRRKRVLKEIRSLKKMQRRVMPSELD